MSTLKVDDRRSPDTTVDVFVENIPHRTVFAFDDGSEGVWFKSTVGASRLDSSSKVVVLHLGNRDMVYNYQPLDAELVIHGVAKEEK